MKSIKDIQHEIAKDNLGEVLVFLKKTAQKSDTEYNGLLIEILLLSARYHDYLKRERLGLEVTNGEMGQIRMGVISVVDIYRTELESLLHGGSSDIEQLTELLVHRGIKILRTFEILVQEMESRNEDWFVVIPEVGALRGEFHTLHLKHLSAIQEGKFILAHEINREIQTLISQLTEYLQQYRIDAGNIYYAKKT